MSIYTAVFCEESIIHVIYTRKCSSACKCSILVGYAYSYKVNTYNPYKLVQMMVRVAYWGSPLNTGNMAAKITLIVSYINAYTYLSTKHVIQQLN